LTQYAGNTTIGIMLVEKRFRLLYAAMFAVFTLFGASMTVIGATLPKIFTDFRWSYAIAGTVMAAGSIGYFLSTYLAGILLAAWGIRLTLSAGLMLISFGLALFAASPGPVLNILLYFLVGVGQGSIELAVDWSTLRMEGPGGGRAMNMMHGAFSVGAFTGPLIIALLMSTSLPWTLIYRGVSLLFFFVLVIVQFLPLRELGKDRGHTPGQRRRDLFRHPAYWLGFLALFVYVGVELGVSNWIAEYFVTVFGTSVPTGSFMVSLFWAGLLAGRFGVPLFLRAPARGKILVSMSILMAAAIILLALSGFWGQSSGGQSSVVVIAGVLVILAGFGCSIVYPTVMSIVGDIFPHTQSEAVGFAAMGGGIGAFVFPYLMSGLSTAWGIRTGFLTYAVFSVAVVAANMALVRAESRHHMQHS
jgi:fucose permease